MYNNKETLDTEINGHEVGSSESQGEKKYWDTLKEKSVFRESLNYGKCNILEGLHMDFLGAGPRMRVFPRKIISDAENVDF